MKAGSMGGVRGSSQHPPTAPRYADPNTGATHEKKNLNIYKCSVYLIDFYTTSLCSDVF